jgi:hypothetical protein
MPTTITSAGITFNDATSLTSANIGTAQLANGSVTAAKLGTNEQKQIAKAWVNFEGTGIGVFNLASGHTITAASGTNVGTYIGPTTSSQYIGHIYYITSIGGVSGATLGGLVVATGGFQITGITNSTTYAIRFINGNATSTQTITGNGVSSGAVLTGTGIRSSFNVSSVTKNGTGDYTVNFATPMADANYCVSGVTNQVSAGNRSLGWDIYNTDTSSLTVNGVRINVGSMSSGGASDVSLITIIIHGN